LIAFWTLDVRGFIGLYIVVVGPFCGLFVPVHFFPEWLRVVAYATPFPSMLQTPIDVLSGWAVGWAAAGLVASQLAWLVGLIGLARLVQRRAARRLVVQGG
jgi:ABC-2 type transport system permease protein